MTRLRLAPSILSIDFARLGEQITAVEPLVDWWHLDVMDGHYVPNITFGPSTVEAVRRVSDLPIHVHLMISDPVFYSEAFARAGADRISFHPEVVDDVGGAVEAIASTGAKVGMAIHPDVPVDSARGHLDDLDVLLMMTVRPGFGGQTFLDEVLPKITEAKSMVERGGFGADIEIDGGVNLSTVEKAVHAGGQILVAGSAIYDGNDPVAAAKKLRQRLEELEDRKESA
jgi:ribulose-phosphate 3-epimerase